MKRVLLSLSLVFLFSVSVVPVSAWATSELAISSSVPVSPAGVDADSIASSDIISEPDQTDAATSATVSEPAGSDEWSVYELTQVETIWDKPFEEYTPTEGYLFLLFVLALSVCIFKLFKGGIW